jgi:hypothetical protein
MGKYGAVAGLFGQHAFNINRAEVNKYYLRK